MAQQEQAEQTLCTVHGFFSQRIRLTEDRGVSLTLRLLILISALFCNHYLHTFVALGALILSLMKLQEFALSNIEQH
jgi:hypothetical protein